MYTDLLPYLRCPSCYNSLNLHTTAADATGEIIAGSLSCASCRVAFVVSDGIADFLGDVRPATPAQVVNDWRLTAWGYERLWRPFALTLFSGELFPYRRELPLIAALVQPRREGLYVDVACSNGLYARALTRARSGAPGHVVGVDHARPMLAVARRFARDAGLRISFVRAEAQRLPLADNAVAGVVIGGSLNEIGDLDGCLAEVRRTLNDAGRYVAMTLTKATTPAGRAAQALTGSGGIRFWSAEELTRRFGRYDLRTVVRWQYGAVVFTLCVCDA